MNLSKDTQSNPNWRGQWLGYICLAMLVFYTWLPNSYYLMVSYPWIIVWQIGFLALGIWIIWMLRQFKIPFKLLGYGLDWAVAAIMVALILSGIFAQFKVVSAWNISLVFCYLMLLYVLRNWIAVESFNIYHLWQRISIAGVISCLVGLAVWYPLRASDASRINYPMGHPNFVAGYIMLVFPLTIALAIASKSWQRIGALAASSLMLFVLYYTGSRGGFLGLLALAIATVIFLIIRSKGKQRWLRLVSCGLVLAILLTVSLNNSRVQRIVKFNGFNSDAPLIQLKIDGQSKDRLLMLEAASNIFKDRPLFGVGAGNMSRVYDLYRPIETGTGGTHIQQLHNTPVQIFGELGLVGLSTYLFLIVCLLRLWFELYYRLTNLRERSLLYGTGGSFLAYSVATLTDYQLENISLSINLVFLTLLLIKLADDNSFEKINIFGNYCRRWISLISITILIASLLLWIPQTLALRLTKIAHRNFVVGRLDVGYKKIADAANLVSWDPTYNITAAIIAMRIREPVREQKLYLELTELSLKHLQKVVEAAPNDAHFNQMLGMMYGDLGNSQSAIEYFRRAIQLLPRISSYSHYLLGREYLKINETEKAITALALQGLITPQFLTSSMWNELPLSEVKNEVLQKSLNLFSKLSQQLSSDNYHYNSVYEKQILLKWLDGQSINKVEHERLRPIIKALLLAEKNPDEALNILASNIETVENPDSLLLLQAWLQPEPYLYNYFKSSTGVNIEKVQREYLENITKQNVALKTWISSIQLKLTTATRNALRLAYRNEEITKASLLFFPSELRDYLIIRKLNLFDDYYREFIELEYLLNKVQTKELSLPHPTNNNFRLD
ncbi:Lipid A core-O-antigen ligase-like enyme [Hyella patelloides LEGE 07179]|uniref:Lipid A core-O-antigen ligase-like enyme n=1 Tax=Hyella patelloides LEGE 07179 TaxID=945734 RepID=A0A563VXZ0_9CYAN|nr:O-antigen ligase family protein [Hyella patelloides]VEP16280.1 Lipid A core-O-antigen ligase-like enyme [Hyella patelloides LEGE 07179]